MAWSAGSPQHPRPGARALRGIVVTAGVAMGIVLGAGTARATSPLDSLATLLWTAPGDDGMIGRATRYDIRMSTASVAGSDTTAWWSAATPVPGLPIPGVPGATDSVTVRGLDPARSYYFVLRTADEIPNWSGFSNLVVRPIVVDGTAPAAISNLSASSPALPALRGGAATEERNRAGP